MQYDLQSDGDVVRLSTNEEASLEKSLEYKRDLLYTQIFSQNIRNQRCVVNHDELTKDFIVEVKRGKGSNALVNICEIRADGNCLYAAIAHQLFNVKINSQEHLLWTDALRKKVVEHIRSNFDSFSMDLKYRLLDESNGRIDIEHLRQNSEELLNRLSRNEAWGGTESLKAISAIFSVNILIIHEDGTCHLAVRFNDNFETTIILCYRTIGRHCTTKNHYDSIVNIADCMLKKFSDDIIKFEEKNIILQKDILNCNNFIFVD